MRVNQKTRILCLLMFIIQSVCIGAAELIIPAGTLVRLNLEENLSSKTSQTGEMVKFTVVESVKIGSRTVIKKGAVARAQLQKVRKPGRFGRNGSLKLRYLTVSSTRGKEIPITLGEKSVKTNESLGLAAGASLGGYMLLGPIGLIGGTFVRGHHIEIPKNTQLIVEVAKDTKF
ncbi:MAG: hypothetical protein PWR01_2295 [Clostridiales bacterium]|nr:hypothetical protein [Clostridiales bacterium]MDN5281222.1 hypothetical protein [Candidatus Ozemobacter sp.]